MGLYGYWITRCTKTIKLDIFIRCRLLYSIISVLVIAALTCGRNLYRSHSEMEGIGQLDKPTKKSNSKQQGSIEKVKHLTKECVNARAQAALVRL
jgi:hypothetical protein